MIDFDTAVRGTNAVFFGVIDKVATYIAVVACTWIGAHVKRAVKDLNCFFQRSRDLEAIITSATSFEDFKQRMAAKIAGREKEINR